MSLSKEQFKEFFRHHGAGVSLITTFSPDGKPAGFTASSLASLSIDPALATVNVAASSSTAALLKAGLKVTIHTLANTNAELADELSGPREGRFQTEGWQLDGAAPVNPKASAVLHGQVSQLIRVAESFILIIEGLEVTLTQFPEKPLVYFNRSYLK